jgi:hypothetical protein
MAGGRHYPILRSSLFAGTWPASPILLAPRPQGHCPGHRTGEGLLHARLRAAFPRATGILPPGSARPVAGCTRVPLRCLRPARARRRYRPLAQPRTAGAGPVATGESGEAPRDIGFSGSVWLPVWLPSGEPPVRHVSGSQFCLVGAYPAARPQAAIRRNDCLAGSRSIERS